MAEKFKLAAVLRVRQLLEEKQKTAFGAALARLTQEEAERRRQEMFLGGQETEYNRSARDSVSVAQLRLREAYLIHLRQRLKAQEAAVEKARGEMDVQRNKLIEATRDRQAVEVLYEKFRKRADYEAAKQNERLLADANIGRFATKRQQDERE